MVRVLAFSALTDQTLTHWSGYYDMADARDHYSLSEAYEWLGLTYDSLIQMDLSQTLTGTTHAEYNVEFVGKGITWADGQITGGTITGILCCQPGQGLPRFGFHVSGLDLSARNVAVAIAEGRAYAGSNLSARMLNADDVFLLSRQADSLHAGRGDDSMEGRAGADTLWGEWGNDTLWGGDGADSLHGGTGHDSLLGGTGRDQLLGGAGRDSLFADQGADDAGRDSLFGGSGADYLESEIGVDLLFGGAGADRLDSRGWDALLNGGSGNDTLIASGHMPTVVTGPGDDLVLLSSEMAVVELGRGETAVFSETGATLRFTTGDGRVEVVSEAMEDMVFHIQSGASGMEDLTIEDSGFGGTMITWGQTVVLLDDFHPDQLSPDQFIFG